MKEILIERSGILTIACILDLIFGDPHGLYHPVRAIGAVISGTEKLLWRMFHLQACPESAECSPAQRRKSRIAGIFLVLIVLIFSLSVPMLSLQFVGRFAGSFWEKLLCIFWCYQLLAAKSLYTESRKVYDALVRNGLTAGRQAVAMIVGRDTAALSEDGVVKAAVETVAENTSDGVIAPMLFFFVCGLPGMFFYKAVNTMDSMVGYRNDRYRYFGTAAARFDDVLNFLPARISGILMVSAAGLCGLAEKYRKKSLHDGNQRRTADIPLFNGRNAGRIFLRDRLKHKSPNSAQTEAACAGALSVQLAGPAGYFGKRVEKPYIGDPLRPIEREDILRANVLMLLTALLCFLLGQACICLASIFLG